MIFHDFLGCPGRTSSEKSDLIYTNSIGILNDVLYNAYFGQYDLEVLAEVIQRLVGEKAVPREMDVSPTVFTELVRAQLKAQGKDGAQAEGLVSQVLWKGRSQVSPVRLPLGCSLVPGKGDKEVPRRGGGIGGGDRDEWL